MKIIIGSTNPAKILAVTDGFKRVWPEKELKVEGLSVPSGVSDQPRSHEESYQGALNRAQSVLEQTDADYAVGIEAGIDSYANQTFTHGWVIILNREGKKGAASTTQCPVFPELKELMDTGLEMGDAVDKIFGTEDQKKKGGYVGLISQNLLSRSQAFSDAIVLALSPFVHDSLF